MCQSDWDPPEAKLDKVNHCNTSENGMSEVYSDAITNFNQPVFVYHVRVKRLITQGRGTGQRWMPVDDTEGGLPGDGATLFEEVFQKIHQ